MCGIIGFTGNIDSKRILIDGLESLEYRGYDSSGVSFFNEKNKVETIKCVGKVENLKKLIDKNLSISNCGIGHTRWATHGNVSIENAHPHKSGFVNLVHNGIIENYISLKDKYDIKNTISSTDTEIAAIILNKFYTETNNDPLVSISRLSKEIKGTYAFCVIFDDRPNEIFAIRKVNPLVSTISNIGSIISSDLTALIPYSKEYYIVPEDSIIKLEQYKIKFYNINNLERINLTPCELNWSNDSTMKDGYPHYMIKEIYEQPKALENTIRPHLKNHIPDFSLENITDEFLKSIDNIQIVACGTALHAGLVACNVFSPIIKIPITAYVASEYRYSEPLITKNTLVIPISQSGETVDTIASLSLAKSYGAKILSVVNVRSSTISRESDFCIFTNAGPEIAVASTKAYTVQIATLFLLFSKIAYLKNMMTIDELINFSKTLELIPQIITDTFSSDKIIKEIAKFLKFKNDCFYIGRLQDYISSLEGALKLKEISYIHTDAYAAGELKHGTIALITQGIPVIAIDTNINISSKLLSNVEEVKAREAAIILIINEKFEYKKDLAKFVVPIKDIDYRFAVFPVSIITQLIAYYTSLEKGLDVDKPRNLAKSVTVE